MPGTCVGSTAARTSSEKRRTGPGPPVTPSTKGHGHVAERPRRRRARCSIAVQGRNAWPAAQDAADTTSTLTDPTGPPDAEEAPSSSAASHSGGRGGGIPFQSRIQKFFRIIRLNEVTFTLSRDA